MDRIAALAIICLMVSVGINLSLVSENEKLKYKIELLKTEIDFKEIDCKYSVQEFLQLKYIMQNQEELIEMYKVNEKLKK